MHRAIIAALAAAACAVTASPPALAQPPGPAQAPEPRMTAPGLMLPGTFSGTLPAASGPGIAHTLDLWPDQVFQLRRVWIDRGVSEDRIGRWFADPDRRAIILDGSGEPPVQFMVRGDGSLRLLDQAGRPIESTLPYTLTRQDRFAPFAPRLQMRGMFLYFADAARFTECVSGRAWPVAMEADFIALQGAYLDTRPPPREGAFPDALLATVEGTVAERPPMEGDGTRPTLVVERFVSLSPGETCARAPAAPALRNVFWRPLTLAGETIGAEADSREPYLLLSLAEPRFVATMGCNRLLGGIEASGEALRFRPGPMTMMACPPPLDARERSLITVLAETVRHRVEGPTLSLLAADGSTLATFEAAYLR